MKRGRNRGRAREGERKGKEGGRGMGKERERGRGKERERGRGRRRERARENSAATPKRLLFLLSTVSLFGLRRALRMPPGSP